MNLRCYFVFSIILSIFSFNSYAQTDTLIFEEGFENGLLPTGWKLEYLSGAVDWRYEKGGYSTTPDIQNTRRPPTAHSGEYNALFQYQSLSGEATKLVTKKIPDFGLAIKPELRFWHAQYEWFHISAYYNDELRVYYKNAKNNPWQLLAEYTEPVEGWAQRVILLPDSTITDDYYIAFEGKTNWGFGACLDDIQIIETGILQRYVESVSTTHPNNEFLASGSNNNPILRIAVKVKGNTGNLALESLIVHSLNENDDDISLDGVKLFTTSDAVFSSSNQLSSSASLINGAASFQNINYNLPTGITYLWVTFDIDEEAEHGHLVDTYVKANDIQINGENYPETDASPAGNRIIYQTVFFDDFETDKGWNLSGEFQRAAPRGLGGNQGNPDPSSAYSDTTVLGSDLTGLGAFEGDYELNLTHNEYIAESPGLDLFYYKDAYVRFFQWLNVDNNDHCSIELSTDNGESWIAIWENEGLLFENEWSLKEIDISDYADRKESVKIRFTVGESNEFWQFSGWNLDDFTITGNYITSDVGVTEWLSPVSGCGLTSGEYVTLIVKNYGPAASKDTIPVGVSLDGGGSWLVDTLFHSIPQGETYTFTFTKPFDLSQPGLYNNIIAKTLLDSDEDSRNDQIDTNLYVVPTYSLPYVEDFESNNGYWRSGGNRKVWEYGTPQNSFISQASSGSRAWVTDLDAFYLANDSVFLESPCFNFAGAKLPVFECNIIHETKENSDGVAFYYSIDDGETWTLFDTLDYKWDWNWYNSENIAALEGPGIDSISDGWVRIRQFLPKEVINQSSVKFRILLESDENGYFMEGAGIDDISIFEAPQDIGMIAFFSPDSACELSSSEEVTVGIYNYGVDTIFAGDTIYAGLNFQGAKLKTDTILLAEDFLPTDTIIHTFDHKVDMFKARNYYFEVFTLLDGDNDYFADSLSNDTIKTYVSVYGMPEYDLGPTIGTEQPDTIILDAGAGYATYQWQHPDSTDRFYHVDGEGKYYVTVTNSYNCSASDTIKVLYSTADIGVIDIISPISACELTNSESVSVKIKNYSGNIYEIGDTIVVAYEYEQNTNIDTIFLTEVVNPEDTISYTFEDELDMTAFGDYPFTIYTILEGDINLKNDTIKPVIEAWGYPDLMFASDTIYTTRADTLVLHAGAEFDTYLWQDGSTNESFDVTSKASKNYKVTVTDIHGCGEDTDSVQIIAYNIGVSSLINPVNACKLEQNEKISIRINNYGADTLISGTTINAFYSLNESSPSYDMITLEEPLLPNTSIVHEFPGTQDLSTIGSYNFLVGVDLFNDVFPSNDQLNKAISHYGFPAIDLGKDTIFTSQADTVLLIAEPGYAIYEWNTGIVNDSLDINSTSSYNYIISVSNSYGCTTKDSVYIFTRDIGVVDLFSPVSNCSLSNQESVTIGITNFATDTFNIGDKIVAAYQLNQNQAVVDTIQLSQKILPYQTFSHTFGTKIDLSSISDYDLKTYTILPHDLNPENDLLDNVVSVYGYPVIDLGTDTIIRAKEYTLDAGSGYDDYVWNDGSEEQYLIIDTTGLYSVNVEDAYGCAGSDNIYVAMLLPDISVSSLTEPVPGCYNNGNKNISVEIVNSGTDTIQIGDRIQISYTYGSQNSITEEIQADTKTHPGESLLYTFSNVQNFFAETDQLLTLYVNYNNDLEPSNDTLKVYAGIYPVPEVDLGEDKIVRAISHTLDAGFGENYSYKWQDNSIGQEYSANKTGIYHVTVVDTISSCLSRDTVILTFLITDLLIAGITAPDQVCERSYQPYTIELKNSGNVNLQTSEVINIGYQSGAHKGSQRITLSQILGVNQTSEVQVNNIFLENTGNQDIRFFVEFENDVNPLNDTLDLQVNALSSPVSDLGGTTDTITTTLPGVLTPAGGYQTYQWQNGSNNQTFTANSEGWYWVKLTGSNSCSYIDSVYVDNITEIKDIFGNGITLALFPNPFNDALTVYSDAEIKEDMTMRMLNAKGQVIQTYVFKKGQRIQEKLNCENLSAGLYSIVFWSGKKLYMRNIVKQ